MNKLRSVLLLTVISSATAVYSQPDSSDVPVLSPDDYTAMILGELEVPSRTGLYRVESSSPAGALNREIPAGPQLSFDSLQEASILQEDAQAVGTLIFIKRLVNDIRKLGVPNSVKLYSHGYNISDESSLMVINTILDINDDHRALINGIKVQNCLKLQDSLGNDGASLAVASFLEDEKQLNTATTDYFRNLNSELATNLPANVFEHFQSVISGMSGSVTIYKADKQMMIEDSGLSPEEFHASTCQRRLQALN